MQKTKSAMPRWQKVVIGVTAALLTLILAAGITVYAIWHNEIATLMSFKMIRDRNDAHLDGAVYTMEVKGGFYLDEFVAQGGVKSDSELIAFVTNSITKGLIPMEINDPEIGCSSFTAKT